MEEHKQQLLQFLNDGEPHSAAALADRLAVDRSMLRQIVGALRSQGVEIQTGQGQTYRLSAPLELLQRDRIMAALPAGARRWIQGIEIHQQLDSTNTYLLERAKQGLDSGSACLAEWQSAGRGRSDKHWVSPFGANLYLSLLWRFARNAAALTGLSLAIGVAIARLLEALGLSDIGLKWPNDLLWRRKKLAGILLEFSGEPGGPCAVVIGAGLNVAMPASTGGAIDQPWIDLHTILGSDRVSRNELGGRLIGELALQCAAFEQEGLVAVIEQWRRYDLTAGRTVALHLPNNTITGTARGVDASGALLLETDTGVQRFMAGEISLRRIQ